MAQNYEPEDDYQALASWLSTKLEGWRNNRDNNNLSRKEFFDSLKVNNGGHNI